MKSLKKTLLRIGIESLIWALAGGAILWALSRSPTAKSWIPNTDVNAEESVQQQFKELRPNRKPDLPNYVTAAAETPWGTPISPEPQYLARTPGASAGYTINLRCPLWVATQPGAGTPQRATKADLDLKTPEPRTIDGYTHTGLSPYAPTTAFSVPLAPEIATTLQSWFQANAGASAYIIGPIFTERVRLAGHQVAPEALYTIAIYGKDVHCTVIGPNYPGHETREVPATLEDITSMTGVRFFPQKRGS